jgi:hypothetical protein
MRAQAQAYAVQIMADTLKVSGPAAEAAKLLIAREVNMYRTLHFCCVWKVFIIC